MEDSRPVVLCSEPVLDLDAEPKASDESKLVAKHESMTANHQPHEQLPEASRDSARSHGKLIIKVR